MPETNGAEFELGRLVTPPPAWAVENLPPAEYLQSRPGHLRICLTGGIASGKSAVARLFAELGAGEIDFDRLAHRAMEPGGAAYEAAEKIFGPEAVGAEGALNRAVLRRVIFSEPEKKAAWEAAIHPEIWRLMGEDLERLAEEKALVITVPLLYETGLETFFSPIALVIVSPAVQLERLLKRNPEMGEKEARRVIASQWPMAAKLRGSHYIINNNGDIAKTARQTRELWGLWH